MAPSHEEPVHGEAPVNLHLRGAKVLVTAEQHMGQRLSEELRKLGAVVVFLPCITTAPPHDPASLRRTLEELHRYHWLVVTSQNGVKALQSTLRAGGQWFDHGTTRLAAVGPATASALAKAGLSPEIVPPRGGSEALLLLYPDFFVAITWWAISI